MAPGSTLTAFDYASCCDNTELVRKKLADVKSADPTSGEALAFRVARMARQCGSKSALLAALETLGLVECPREKWEEFYESIYLAELPGRFCRRSQKRLPYNQEERQWLNYAIIS